MNDFLKHPTEGERLAVEKSGIGPIIGAIIVVILLAVGGLYYWGAYLEERSGGPAEGAPDTVLETLRSQSASDEADAIQTDLDATDLDAITSDIDKIAL